MVPAAKWYCSGGAVGLSGVIVMSWGPSGCGVIGTVGVIVASAPTGAGDGGT